MILLNPALLVGLAVVALPVILHWLLRAKPKPLPFPALRLIQMRRRHNSQRMRLRHLWLLLLRILVLGVLVLAVARPSVPAADYSLTGSDWLRALGLAGFLAAVLWGAESLWKRRAIPPHQLQSRRSLLRGGLGVAAVILFILLLALPYQKRIAASITQPTITAAQTLPVAAVLLFDNSLSMQYGFESRTRLDVARDIALQHVRNLPSQSRVAVGEITSDAALRFQVERGGAQARIESLQLQPFSRPIEDRLVAAFELHRDDAARQAQPGAAAAEGDAGTAPESVLREIYLFTDLALSAWRRDTSVRLQELLQKMPNVSIYLIDVGITNPQNASVTGLVLSKESLALGTELTIRVTVSAVGPEAATRNVELYVMNEVGKPVKKGQAPSLKIEPGGSGQVEFSLRGLTGPVAQGEVRLTTADPLAFDDSRPFSIRVHRPQELLLVADSRTDAQFINDALAEEEEVKLGRASYRCRYIPPSRLATEPLKPFAAVFLIDVPDPRSAGWKALAAYAREGGGVGIALGPQVNHEAYISPDAQTVLPALLLAKSKFKPPEFLDFSKLTHPLFQKFSDRAAGVALLTETPIYGYWRVKPFDEARVIFSYSDPVDNRPAWLERTIGKGRVVLFTSALNRRGWNDLPIAGNWAFLAMMDFWTQYLTQATQAKFNYLAGEPVSLTLSSLEEAAGGYLLRKPEKQQLPGDIPAGSLTLSPSPRDLDQLGNYRVLGPSPDSKLDIGFSIAADPAESRLDRIGPEDLDRILGKDRYSISRDIENLKRRVLQGRVGREAFPLLAIVLLAVFICEHLVANFFYDAPREETDKSGVKAT